MANEKHILSKSTFMRGAQCAKSLYLYKNFIQLRDKQSAEQTAIFSRGNKVGLLAQKLFPGGTDASPAKKGDHISGVERTRQLISEGATIIYEASFQAENVLAILDILVKKDDAWYAYEVKSSVKISHAYLTDASLQYWVITRSGIELQDFSLITMNKEYVRSGDLDLENLFTITSVKEDCIRNNETITQKVTASLLVAASAEMPQIPIGEHCFSPYSCDFMGTCWKSVPKNSVFEITGLNKSDQFGLYNAGFRMITEIPDEHQLDKNSRAHVNAVKSGQPIIDKEKLAAFFKKIIYPVSFMDFETFMPAVPLYNNTKPYQHIPFQYSIHKKSNPAAVAEHFEFLAEQGLDPRKSFLISLLNHTEGEGSILVYDALMEKNVLKGLMKDFPEYTAQITARLSRLVDLMHPFQDKAYYHPAMKNSFSIKNVFPAMVEGTSFSDLKISSGSIAMIAYEQLQSETDMFRIIEVREQLLDYCRMDTFAMLRIFEVLENSALR